VTSETAGWRRRLLPAALAGPVSASGWLATISVAWSLAVNSAGAVVLMVLLFFGVPLMLLALVGLPIVWVAFGVARCLAILERRKAAVFLGADLPLRPPSPRKGALPSRMWARTKTLGTWLELV